MLNINAIIPEAYYNRKEAAAIMDRNVCQINRWVNQGLLKQHFLRGSTKPHYKGESLRRLLIEKR